MRNVILQEWVTIDGYAAGPNGELDFFPAPELSKDSDEDIFGFMDNIDTILLGAVTYHMFADYWPQATTDMEIIADRLNSTLKFVFSRTLKQAPWGKWQPATVISADAVEAVRDLKQQPGKDMVLWGSISLAQSLMKADLIDEYHLRVCPSVLGTGKALFPSELARPQMKPIDTRTYESGVILLRYESV
ncbi:dihydrofolate reductase family protein [Spirosoma validum]|uniref:Dihydrofolate reductase family protein n=1 Tax=Spirosoma validum TaxID=2771355 RepID=A0A927B785_9BACT|nr:dihydrofolate reductase family protein [Spirosoma validum]MBD2756659.1 dihydrofolate reductase family protein [Spirosoma validum]